MQLLYQTTEKKLAERFKGLPTIGNAMEPDMEIVKSLNPTDVLSVSTLEYDLQDKLQATENTCTFFKFPKCGCNDGGN
ncbi:hypothetical protein LSPH24S_08270 [Lysinibacillus sphaericus]